MKAHKDRPGGDAADWVCFGLIVVVGDLLTNSLMRPFLIEVNGKFLDHSPQMLTSKDENVIQAFSFQAAHEPFAYAIRSRSSIRGLQFYNCPGYLTYPFDILGFSMKILSEVGYVY